VKSRAQYNSKSRLTRSGGKAQQKEIVYMFTFNVTDQEYWKNKRGYSKSNGKVLDIESLTSDLLEQIRNKEILVSGDLLVHFGNSHNNSNVDIMLETGCARLKRNILSATNLPNKILRGKTLRGINVQSLTGVSPYRLRI